MKYRDLREFLAELERRGQLKRILTPVDPSEITEIADRVLRAGGPALLLKIPKVIVSRYWPISLGRLNVWLWAWGPSQLSSCVKWAVCWPISKNQSPKGFRDALNKLPLFKQVMSMSPEKCARRLVRRSYLKVISGSVNLAGADLLAGRRRALITWPLVVTRGPEKPRQNLGIYRQRVIG